MPDCVFCKIVAGELPATKEYEDQDILGLKSIEPQADTHIMFIPKQHIGKLSEVEQPDILGKLLFALRNTAIKMNITDYKVIINHGKYQHVPHLHVHLLGGTLKGGII